MSTRIGLLCCLAGSMMLGGSAKRGLAQAPAAPKPAAVVDGTPIMMSEVEAVLREAGPKATPLTEAQRRQMQMEAVGMLIDDLLLQQYLRRNGARIDVADVNKKVQELEEGLKKQGKTIQEFYKDSGQTEAGLRSSIVTMLQWEAWVRDHVTEADLHKYFEDNREFFDRVAVRASHIELRIPPNTSEVERQAAKAKLQAIRQDIVAGKLDFAEAAKKYSQSSTAASGGDLAYFPRKFVVEEPFAKTAFAMKVGEVSDVVQTEFGMHLIKVTDRKPGQPSDYTKMKEEVRELYLAEMRMGLLEQQRKVAHVEINLP